MAQAIAEAKIISSESGDIYLVVRILQSSCMSYKYLVYRWHLHNDHLELMEKKANTIMKQLLDDSNIPYPKKEYGSKVDSKTEQTGNLLWDHVKRMEHHHRSEMSKLYSDGRFVKKQKEGNSSDGKKEEDN